MAFVSITLPVRGRPRAPTVVTTRSALPHATPKLSRRALLALAAAAAATAGTTASYAETTTSGLSYTTVKQGAGPQAVIGDLVGIRFKGSFNGVVFDNLFESREPYFYRVGSENILKGIDEAVQLMHVGDVYDLSLPSTLAFGKKGRRASAGKPSIPPDANVDYTLELSAIPDKLSMGNCYPAFPFNGPYPMRAPG